MLDAPRLRGDCPAAADGGRESTYVIPKERNTAAERASGQGVVEDIGDGASMDLYTPLDSPKTPLCNGIVLLAFAVLNLLFHILRILHILQNVLSWPAEQDCPFSLQDSPAKGGIIHKTL